MIPLDAIEHPGYKVDEQINDFLSEAVSSEYMTKEGKNLREAFECFEDMANRVPDSIRTAWKGGIGQLRVACYALVADGTWNSSLDRADVIKAIADGLKKEDVVKAMAYFGSCVNEYYRLQYVVQMYGGFQTQEGGAE